MRRLVSILLVVLISIVLIVSCDADKAGNGGGSKPDSPSSVNMTDSYKTGRENFHFVTGVWLPELESVELLGSSDFSTEFGTFAEACFDILGDKTRYDSIANYLEGVLGNPVNKEADTQAWSLARTVDGKDYDGEIFMIYDDNDAEHPAIYINCLLSLKQNYKSYRVLLHDRTGIWLPESENAQLLESSDIPYSNTRETFTIDLTYDAALFSSIVSALKTSLPQNPLMNEEGEIALWEYLVSKDGSAHDVMEGETADTESKINWQVEKTTDDKENQIISILYLKRNYYTVSVSAGEGGSVQMRASGKVVEGNSFRGTDDWKLELTATPAEGYSFDGWYRENRKISSSSTYNYSPRGDETITAKFTK